MAEHSFHEPMRNSLLLLSYLFFGARFFVRGKVNHRRVYSRILAEVCAVVNGKWDGQKQGLKMCIKKIQLLDFVHHLPTTN